MRNCSQCDGNSDVCLHSCFRADNDNELPRFDPTVIRAPEAMTLSQPWFMHRLAMPYVDMGLTRRSVLDMVNDRVMNFEGIVLNHRRQKINHLAIDVDAVFRTDEDPSERWLSSFLKFAARPPSRNAQRRIVPRLMLLWLAIAIDNRRMAEHIAT